MDKPSLSIVVPCYNSQETLARCLDSILAQKGVPIEAICVDDGSTDGTAKILDSYASAQTNVIRVIHQQNQGVWKARQAGIAAAKAPYIGFLDSDDSLDENYSLQMVNAITSQGADIVVCGYQRFSQETGSLLSEELCAKRDDLTISDDPGRTVEINSAVWNKAFRADIINNLLELPIPPAIAEDFLFCTLAYERCTGKIVFVAEPLVHYYVSESSAMNSITEDQIVSTYRAMAFVRDHLESKGSSNLLEAYDLSVFLHLGVSLPHRLSMNPKINLGRYVKECTGILDATFSTWRRNPYIHARYVMSHGRSFLLLKVAHTAFKLGLIAPLLDAYQAATKTLGIDLKW